MVSMRNHGSLGTDLGLAGLQGNALGHLGLRLGSHNTSTPNLAGLLKLVIVVGLDGLDQGSQVLLVLGAHLGQGNGSGGLLVNQGSQTALALDNAVRHVHLAAQGGQPNNQLQKY